MNVDILVFIIVGEISLNKTFTPFNVQQEFKREMINNQEFYLMNASINYMGLPIRQVYYSTIQNGFCLSIVISFIDDEQNIPGIYHNIATNIRVVVYITHGAFPYPVKIQPYQIAAGINGRTA